MAKLDTTKSPTGLELYSYAAEQASNEVIRAYSTSFSMAVSLLGKNVRQAVRNIYALVRVADEIVDGAAADARIAGGSVNPTLELDALEAETYAALEKGFSTNLVVHAFARTANQVGFGRELIEPFFYSMRQDLTAQGHNQESFDRYVYGSAEVVGLMCLAAFIKFANQTYSQEEKLAMADGARALGAAFQKVNFLRDLAADFKSLGRSYFPNVSVNNFDDSTKDRLVADINEDLAEAAKAIRLLPKNCRSAVAAAQLLFAELNTQISKTPASQLINRRISVSNSTKLRLVARAVLTGRA